MRPAAILPTRPSALLTYFCLAGPPLLGSPKNIFCLATKPALGSPVFELRPSVCKTIKSVSNTNWLSHKIYKQTRCRLSFVKRRYPGGNEMLIPVLTKLRHCKLSRLQSTNSQQLYLTSTLKVSYQLRELLSSYNSTLIVNSSSCPWHLFLLPILDKERQVLFFFCNLLFLRYVFLLQHSCLSVPNFPTFHTKQHSSDLCDNS